MINPKSNLVWVQKKESNGVFEEMMFAIIRPPRVKYYQEVLGKQLQSGPKILQWKNKKVMRHDYWVPFQQIFEIPVSIFSPLEKKIDCYLIYCHGNSSSRIQSLAIVDQMPDHYCLVSFDFIGCGNSKVSQQKINKNNEQNDKEKFVDSGKYLTLGLRQSKQIQCIVKWVQNLNKQIPIILWGRSMGASSILKYGGTLINIVDSPFQSLSRVCKQLALTQNPCFCPICAFNCVFSCLYCKINRDIRKNAGFEIQDLNISESIKSIDSKKRILFLAGESDTMINTEHSIDLYKNFKGYKQLVIFQGTHNSKRPPDIIRKIFNFIEFSISQIKLLKYHKYT